MKNRILYIAILFAILFMGGCETTTYESAPPEALNAAQQGLQALQALASLNPQQEGFSNAEEAASATLGVGMKVYYMHISQIAQYKEGNAPEELIIEGNEWMYEMLVNGQAKAAILVRKTGENWAVAEMGNASLIQAITEVKNRHMQENHMKDEAYSIIRIPGMYHYWLTFSDKGESYFLHVFDRPELGHKKHDVHPMQEVITAIAASAQDFESAIQEP